MLKVTCSGQRGVVGNAADETERLRPHVSWRGPRCLTEPHSPGRSAQRLLTKLALHTNSPPSTYCCFVSLEPPRPLPSAPATRSATPLLAPGVTGNLMGRGSTRDHWQRPPIGFSARRHVFLGVGREVGRGSRCHRDAQGRCPQVPLF